MAKPVVAGPVLRLPFGRPPNWPSHHHPLNYPTEGVLPILPV